MDSVCIATCASGTAIHAKLGDIAPFNYVTLLSTSLFGSGACLFLINVAIWFDFEGISEALGNSFIIGSCMMLGFSQAACDLGDNLIKKRRGTVYRCAGDIIAQCCAAAVLSSGTPYWNILTIPAAATFLTSRLGGNFVTENLATERNEAAQARRESVGDSESASGSTHPATNQYLCMAYHMITSGLSKLTDYVMYFWLPYYLGKSYDPVTANIVTVAYSVGMIPSDIIAEHFLKIVGERQLPGFGLLMGLRIMLLSLLAQSKTELSPITCIIVLAFMGFLVGAYVLHYVLYLRNLLLSLTSHQLPSLLSTLGADQTLSMTLSSKPNWPRTRFIERTNRSAS